MSLSFWNQSSRLGSPFSAPLPLWLTPAPAPAPVSPVAAAPHSTQLWLSWVGLGLRCVWEQ